MSSKVYSQPEADNLLDKYNDDTSEYDQTVSIDGSVVSKLSTCKFNQES